MQLTKKINLKVFIPVSLINTALFLFFASSQKDVYVIIGIYLATLLNLYLLLSVILKIVEIGSSPEPVEYSKLNLALIFVAKMAIIFLALTIGVHFMGKRIIIPLLNYVFQTFVLGVSMRRSS